MKNISSLTILFQKAKKLGNARKNKLNQEEISKLEADLKNYEELCLKSDEINTGLTHKDLI